MKKSSWFFTIGILCILSFFITTDIVGADKYVTPRFIIVFGVVFLMIGFYCWSENN